MKISEPETFLFTSESVGEGHPDKICDQIADYILDVCLKDDPLSKIAIEVAVRCDMVIVFGVVESSVAFDVEKIVRLVLKDIGYDSTDQEINYQTCQVMDYVERRIPGLSRRVPNSGHLSDLKPAEGEKAVDQGIIFGYASDETTQLL